MHTKVMRALDTKGQVARRPALHASSFFPSALKRKKKFEVKYSDEEEDEGPGQRVVTVGQLLSR